MTGASEIADKPRRFSAGFVWERRAWLACCEAARGSGLVPMRGRSSCWSVRRSAPHCSSARRRRRSTVKSSATASHLEVGLRRSPLRAEMLVEAIEQLLDQPSRSELLAEQP